jgi:hypothetical protein
VGVVDRKLELVENIARLRRATRVLPRDRDLTAVRLSLERELGETVSRRLAARVLGVSHTALERWIATGDVGVVYSPSGRLEIAVPALLDLYEAVAADRANGARRCVLAPTLARRRAAARRLRVHDPRAGRPRDPHERARARSLAYHRAIARRLRRATVHEARHVLLRWRAQGRLDERHAARWQALLDQPLPEIRRALVEDSPTGDDLRQTSPFAGLLSEPERQRILRAIA